MTVAHVLIAETEFLRSEQQRHGTCTLAYQPHAVLEPAQWMLQCPIADGGCADHESAVRHRVGNCCEFTCGLQYCRRPHSRSRLLERHMVGIYQPKMRKSEIGNGASGGPDVERVPRGDDYDTQVFQRSSSITASSTSRGGRVIDCGNVPNGRSTTFSMSIKFTAWLFTYSTPVSTSSVDSVS